MNVDDDVNRKGSCRVRRGAAVVSAILILHSGGNEGVKKMDEYRDGMVW